MIPAATIAQARAMPMPQLVARDRRMKRTGAVWMALCPVHAERTPSLAVYADHAFCFGCGFSADPIDWLRVTRGLDFAAAVGELAGGVGAARQSPQHPVNDSRHSPRPGQGDDKLPALISRLWAEATDPSIARVYLRSRGLPCEPLSEALRGHPAVWCSETRTERPCVLAAVEAPGRGITALHRIWTRTVYLASEGEDARPSDLLARKKTLGRLEDGAVRLLPPGPGDRLGLAEGTESAAKAGMLYRRSTWAVLGVSRFGHPSARRERPDGSSYRVEERPPSVWIPPSVRDLVIFGDRDGGPGEEAALWAAWFWRRQGLAARAIFPPEGVKDFADLN